jgi:hypothetical protein
MRVKSIIVLIAIAFSILSPLSLHLTIAQGHASIEGLDVCHAGSFALAPGHDVPCISEPLYRPCSPSRIENAQIQEPTLRVLIAASQEERPPKS